MMTDPTIKGWLNDTYLEKMQQYSFVFRYLVEKYIPDATIDGEKKSTMAMVWRLKWIWKPEV